MFDSESRPRGDGTPPSVFDSESRPRGDGTPPSVFDSGSSLRGDGTPPSLFDSGSVPQGDSAGEISCEHSGGNSPPLQLVTSASPTSLGVEVITPPPTGDNIFPHSSGSSGSRSQRLEVMFRAVFTL